MEMPTFFRAELPIFSPDLESGACRKFSLGNRPTIKRLVQKRDQVRIEPGSICLAHYQCPIGNFLYQRGGVLATDLTTQERLRETVTRSRSSDGSVPVRDVPQASRILRPPCVSHIPDKSERWQNEALEERVERIQ